VNVDQVKERTEKDVCLISERENRKLLTNVIESDDFKKRFHLPGKTPSLPVTSVFVVR
jgi:hypothetical protein